MSTITINYTANYGGNHRICYRQVGTTNYCCLLDTVAAIGPQTFTIDFSVPADYCFGTANQVTTPVVSDCGPYEYEGYVQPICETIDSLDARTPFTVSFTQVPTCLSYEVECITTDVASIALDSAGEAYLSFPTITFTGGPCSVSSAATVTTMEAFNVQSSFPNVSTGYSPLNVITITGGVGTPITIRVDTVDGGGSIQTFTVLNNGSYTTLPGTTNVASTVAPAGGTGATFNINYQVETITVGTLGTGCSGPVQAQFVGGTPEVQGAIVVAMDPCPTFASPSCGAVQNVEGEIAVPVIFCESTGAPVLDPAYNVTPIGTCCNCKRVTAIVTGDLGTVLPYYYYTDYLTKNVIYVAGPIALNPGGVNLGTFQIQEGSFATAPGFNANLTLTEADCI
jgi:hypothetical protein